MNNLVDIRDLPKHAVLAALWNHATKQSVFDVRPAMSATRATSLVEDTTHLNFDWVDSRSVKVDLTADWFDPWLYDRDNGGDGAALRVVRNLRANMEKPNAEIPKVDARKASQVLKDHEGSAQEEALSKWEDDGGGCGHHRQTAEDDPVA